MDERRKYYGRSMQARRRRAAAASGIDGGLQHRQPPPLRRQGIQRLRRREPPRLRHPTPRLFSDTPLHNHGPAVREAPRRKPLHLRRRKPRDEDRPYGIGMVLL